MVFVTLAIFTLNLYMSNKKEKTKNAEINSNRLYSIVVFFLLLFSLAFDLLISKFDIDISIYVYIFVAIGETIFFIIQNAKREEEIRRKHEEMKQILQCLSPVIEVPKGEELDLEGDYGLEINRDKNGKVNSIKCQIQDPDKWSDAVLVKIVLNMNKYLPDKRWTNRVDFPTLEAEFTGSDLPPKMAKYPGSLLRPWNYIPVGVDGNDELGINLGAKDKNIGDSMFVFNEDNSAGGSIVDNKQDDSKWDSIKKGWRKAGVKIPPKTPQLMILGSTGGGKAIFSGQVVQIKD